MDSRDREGAARAGDVLHVSADRDHDRDRVECARTTLNSRCQCAHLCRNPRLYLHHIRLHSPQLCYDGGEDVVDGGAFADGGHISVQVAPLRIVLPYHDGATRRDVCHPLISDAIDHRVTESFCSDVDTVEYSASDCKALDTVSSRGSVHSFGRHALAFDFPRV